MALNSPTIHSSRRDSDNGLNDDNSDHRVALSYDTCLTVLDHGDCVNCLISLRCDDDNLGYRKRGM